jgi:hypothetical protein
MAEIKKQIQPQANTAVKQAPASKKNIIAAPAIFSKENYKWMAIGGIIIIFGMILMSGGKNANPNTFDYNVVYSFTRITVAPILIVLGLLVEIYAIFRKPKQVANA